MDAHWEDEDPEDLTLVTPGGRYEDSLAVYVDRELPYQYSQQMKLYMTELIDGDKTGEPLGAFHHTRQETDMPITGGQITIMETFAPRSVPIPGPGEPPNDMRPRDVDRTKIKAARKMARVNRRKRGRK